MLEKHCKTYKEFDGEDLQIADRIQHLRYLMLIHSRIYYVLNGNLLSDKEFDALAYELRDLQNEHPNISEKVDWYDAFKDWDGSTGAFLPLDDPWVVERTSLVFTLDKRVAKIMDKNMHKVSVKEESVTEETPEEEKEEFSDGEQMSLEDFLELAM